MATKAKMVVVRTYSAGVHFGELVSRKGQEIVLKNARRLWNWTGANSLNEVAAHGVATGSKVSDPVSENTLTQAIEILAMSPEAARRFASQGWGK